MAYHHDYETLEDLLTQSSSPQELWEALDRALLLITWYEEEHPGTDYLKYYYPLWSLRNAIAKTQ